MYRIDLRGYYACISIPYNQWRTITSPPHKQSRGNMDTVITPQLHKLATVSERTGLGRTVLYEQIKAGKLKVVRVGRAVRVKEADLADFINLMPNS